MRSVAIETPACEAYETDVHTKRLVLDTITIIRAYSKSKYTDVAVVGKCSYLVIKALRALLAVNLLRQARRLKFRKIDEMRTGAHVRFPVANLSCT